MELTKSLMISAAGMRVQSSRMRVIAENIANSDSVSSTPDGDAYRRKIITFKNALDKALNTSTVQVDKIKVDRTPFGLRFDPDHPGANAEGYVRLPNINPFIEMMDMREAQRSYEANLAAIESSRSMIQSTIDLIR